MFILDVQQEKNLKKTRISHAISNLGGCLLLSLVAVAVCSCVLWDVPDAAL